MTNGCPNQTGTLSVYAGVGVGGTLLYSGSASFPNVCNAYVGNTIPYGSCAVTSGSNYTWRFQMGGSISTVVNTGNVYSGSFFSTTHGAAANYDSRFRTYVTGTVFPTATASAGSATTFCQGGNVTLTANTGAFNYQWNNGLSPIGGATAQTYAANTSGNYNVKVTNTTTNCWNTSTPDIAVTVNPLPTIGTSQTNVSCNGGSNGTATATPSGATAPYSYSWAPSGGTGATASGLLPGTYTVTVTDAKPCSNTQAYTITQPTALSATTSQVNVSCFGGSNGSATSTGTGGTGPYTYSWAPSGGTAATASGRTAGTYTCTVTDANGCTITRSFTITQPPVLTTALSSSTNVSCNGGSNGAATISASGGTTAYSYNWTPGTPTGDGTVSVTGLTAGTWTCTVTDANACVATQTVSITQPTALTTSAVSQTNVSCNGGSNGAASISASGGTTAYTYNWTPGTPTGDGTVSVTGLTAGTWTCTVTDANSCVATRTVSITQPTALSATTSQTNVSCFGGSNGSATSTGTAGTPGYTYSWAPSGGTAATATGLSQGGYTCTIIDANSCSTTRSFTITQPTVLTATTGQTNVLCNAAATGSMTVTPAGGTTAYSYSWSPSGGTGATASGRTAGNYTCTITDANSCSLQKTFTLTEPTALTATTGQTNILCNGAATGSMTVTPGGGVASYSYSWSPSGGTGATASGRTAGNYTCTITDANACSIQKTFTLTQPSVLTATTSQTNVSCNGGSDGTATVTSAGGVAAYSYSWAPGGGTASTAIGLALGNYTCTITDANACSIQKTFSITQPTSLTATTSKNTVSCFGLSDGDATVNPSGGTPSYTYSWAPSGGTASTASGLSAASYTCTIMDANGCVINKTINITQPAALSAAVSQTNISCNGAGNGTAAVTVSGGTLAYSYAWSPAGGSASSATGLAPGTYTCNITDANLCTLQKTFSITEPTALTITGSQSDVTCNGANNGTATVSIAGGTSGYTYSWTPSGGTASTATALAPNSYTCTVTDANSCVITQAFVIAEPAALTISATQTNVSCNASSDGSATVSVNGGTSAYTYLWSPSGGTASMASGLTAGTYTCDVTDANNCTIQQLVTITQPSVLTANPSVTNVSCNGISDGAITISSAGGTPGYSYSWSPNVSATSSASGLAAGTYSCTVSDANACNTTLTIVITEPAILSSTSSQLNVSCNGLNNGTATVSVSGGTTAYAYSWSPSGGTAATATNLAPGSYTCAVTDAQNCATQSVVTITEPAILTASSSQTNVSCNSGSDGSASVAVSGGTTSYSYAWLPSGGTAATATGLSAGNYSCTITDANNCTTQQTFNITEPSTLTASTSQVNAACNGGASGSATINASGGSGSYTYSWSPSGGTAATASGLIAGTYTCIITDANGCSISKTFTITQPPALSVSGASINASCFGGSNGSATVAVAGGTPAYTYSWSPSGGSTANAQGLSAGGYTCTITDSKACTITQTFSISQPASGVSITVSTIPAACNTSNGSATALVTGGTSPYIYQWSCGSSQALADSLAAGQYFLQVYDNVGCYSTKVVTINNTNAPSVSLGSLTNVSCNGGNNGAVSVNVSGGASPYTFLWSDGSTTSATTNLQAGPYDVTITDANNCTVSQTYTVTQPAALSAVFSISPATCGASDGSATITVSGGTTAYNYQWSANAAGQTTATAINLSSGLYSVSIMDANGCTLTKVGTVSSAGSTLAVAVDTVIQGGCSSISSGSIDITTSGGTMPYTFAWNNGATTEDISGLSPGNYVVLVTDSNNCSASQTINVASSMQGYQPEICIVTVDTATLTNLVVWEKTLTEGIQSFKIHRETSSPGVYQVVGTVPYDSLSQFTDAVANPQIRSWRYKITAMDSCGVQTPFSQPHKTIHLAQNLGFSSSINLAWDYYDGFSYSTYFIWRHDPSTGWMKIDSLPVTLTSYTDLAPPSVNSRYMIEIIPSTGCTSTRGAINTSRSNIKVSTVGSTGIAGVNASEMFLSVYPNPANDQINVRMEQKEKEKMTLRLIDPLGRVVFEKAIEASSVNEKISLNGFDNGLYLLEVRTPRSVKQVKIIKQQ
ncbi:MAG: T9SS type A sorting domain-containing protein [Bacteroidia bacterium]